MKTALKILALIVAVLVVLLLLRAVGIFFALFNATELSYTDIVELDGFHFLTRDERPWTLFHLAEGKKAAVESIDYDPDSGVTAFTIPERWGDYPVIALGGYYGRGAPCPFSIEVKGVEAALGVCPEAGSFSKVNGKRAELVYHDLTLYLGADIREIFADQWGLYTETGGGAGEIHVVRVYIDCDPANRDFYSENGRLYDKKGRLVKGFFYWDEDFLS
ncbi:MAG: hypothetical protein IK095_00470 [Oscillospiraceae bacterium]|nr:hypothetical protein [Oscillospiraceae bacterium]